MCSIVSAIHFWTFCLRWKYHNFGSNYHAEIKDSRKMLGSFENFSSFQIWKILKLTWCIRYAIFQRRHNLKLSLRWVYQELICFCLAWYFNNLLKLSNKIAGLKSDENLTSVVLALQHISIDSENFYAHWLRPEVLHLWTIFFRCQTMTFFSCSCKNWKCFYWDFYHIVWCRVFVWIGQNKRNVIGITGFVRRIKS